MSKALIIIDMQANLFAAPMAHRIEDVAALLSVLADKARAAGVPVIFVQHEEDGSEWERGTPGWEFHPSLAPRDGDAVVAKHHCDSFRNTELAPVLARLGADELIVGGYASDYCVDTTIRAAASRDIRTVVIADGHTTSDRPHLDAASIVRHHGHVWSTFDGNVVLRNSGDIVF